MILSNSVNNKNKLECNIPPAQLAFYKEDNLSVIYKKLLITHAKRKPLLVVQLRYI